MTRLRDNIPDELKKLNHWVVWRWETRDGNRTKPPRRSDNLELADSADPKTWSAFALAVDRLESREIEGIGFAVCTDDPYVGLDLDHCRNPKTGAIDPWAQAIVDRFQSYTEVTPSGEGLRVWIHGHKPGSKSEKAMGEVGEIGIYETGRYFTVTGRHVRGTPLAIEDRQDELESLYAELWPTKPHSNGSRPATGPSAYEVLELARQHKNAGKWDRLMRGDTSDYKSPSEGDAALCALAAFYTRDPGTIDQLVRMSGLSREKWDRQDYRERTIGAALELVSETFSANSVPPLAVGTQRRFLAENGEIGLVGTLLSEVQPEEVDWLWYGRLARGKVTLIDGDPGRGKSVLSLDFAGHITTGSRWPDGQICEKGGVVVLSAEDGLADTIRPRLDAAGGDPSRVVALDLIGAGEQRRPVTLPDDLAYVEAAVHRVEATVVVVDPLMAYLSGDVNSHRDQDVRRALRPLAELADRLRVAVVVIRHLNKTTGIAAIYRGGGSIGIIGAARIGLMVAPAPEDPEQRVLAPIKANLSIPPASLIYRLVDHHGVVRIQWEGISELTAEQLIASQVADDSDRSAVADAEGFLRELLMDGPFDSQGVKIAARKAGIAERTLWRAKASLGIETHKQGFGKGAPWEWTLPSFSAKKPHSLPMPKDGTLGQRMVCPHTSVSTVAGQTTCLRCGQELP